jgi:serine/threonine protein kinase
MEVMTEGRFCIHCGYDYQAMPENPLFMKPGTKIGNYEFGKVLGHGGFGITYLGYDSENKRKVAIKEYLPADLATRHANTTEVAIYTGEKEQSFKIGIEKFKQEAQMLQNFSDFPGIVDIYDLFEANHTAYFVMEYIEGITLKEYAEQMGGRLPFETVRTILMPVIDALTEMHRKDILHRDISPDNIYITAAKQVKLLDFGAARQTIQDQNKGLSVILKHGFTPKEQYFTKGNQGPWTDVYALGATAYYLMTGTIPQPALDRLEQDKLVPVTSYIPVSPYVDAVIRKSLAVEEYNRYQTVKDFKSALLNPESQAPIMFAPQSQSLMQSPGGYQNYQQQAPQPGMYHNYTQSGIPAQGLPPQGASMQGIPPQSMLSQGVPPQGIPYQSIPQNGMSQPNSNVSPSGMPQSSMYQNKSQMPMQQTPYKKTKKKTTIVLCVTLPILVITLGLMLIYLTMPRVPNVVGYHSEEAIEALQQKGFIVDETEIVYEYNNDVAKGEVMVQSPRADKRTFDKDIELIVSQGPEAITIPDVVGKPSAEASDTLTGLGFEVITSEVFSDKEPGIVLQMDETPGEEAAVGTKITLTISKGLDPNIIIIEDANFLKAIKVSMKLNDNEVITKDMAKLVKELDVSFQEIQSLNGVEEFINLETLDASDNQLTEVPKLPSTLTDINLSYNQLYDLDVSNCVNLYYLNASSNFISELPALPVNVEFINLSSNAIKNISGIASLNKLYSLDLSYNSIQDFSPLDEFTYEVSYLYTEGNLGSYSTEVVAGSWVDSIFPTYYETDIISTSYPDNHETYSLLTEITMTDLMDDPDIYYYGPFENEYGQYDIYSMDYEDGSVDFYMDTATGVCSFYEVYGASYPYLSSDILCQYSTYEDLGYYLGAPSDQYTSDGYVYMDYIEQDIVYRFALNMDGIIESLIILREDYYYSE